MKTLRMSGVNGPESCAGEQLSAHCSDLDLASRWTGEFQAELLPFSRFSRKTSNRAPRLRPAWIHSVIGSADCLFDCTGAAFSSGVWHTATLSPNAPVPPLSEKKESNPPPEHKKGPAFPHNDTLRTDQKRAPWRVCFHDILSGQLSN